MPVISGQDESEKVTFDWQSEYLRKINEPTDLSLELRRELFLTGYTDMHPGLDFIIPAESHQNRGMSDMLPAWSPYDALK